MAAHSGILAWRIRGQTSLAGCGPWVTESDMTEPTQYACMHTKGGSASQLHGNRENRCLPFAVSVQGARGASSFGRFPPVLGPQILSSRKVWQILTTLTDLGQKTQGGS